MDFKEGLIKCINKQINEKAVLETPPNQNLGDYSLPCFKLSKTPQELQKILKLPKYIEKTEIKGSYLNFFINQNQLTKTILQKIIKEKKNYGSKNIGMKKKALVEHTSINPNASPHLGRARNAIIGDAIVRILKFQKYKVETHYYVNDIGKQIAMLVIACKGKKTTFKNLLNYYVKFNSEMEKNTALEKEVLNLLLKLETGDKNTQKDFKKIVELCINGQYNILKKLDINYDFFDYESDFLDEAKKILIKLEQTGKVFTDEEGRKTINLEGFNLPMENPLLPLTRSDKTSMYLLRDLAYTIYKEKRVKEKNILVLGEDQKLYFLQLKTLLSILGFNSPEVIHYSYVLLPSGKMSTRKGEVILLEDFLNEIKLKSKKELIKRHGKIKNIEKISETIGYGAAKFSILKVDPDKNIVFDIEKALSFEGESCPYIQYANIRANSILKKAKIKKPNYKLINTEIEKKLVKKLAEFPGIIESSSIKLHPHIIANYLIELSKNFNEFYQKYNVINEKEPIRSARLGVVLATKIVLTNGLELLGIKTPTLM